MIPARSGRRRSKFGAQPVEIDGVRFASKREARHYAALQLRERAGEISELRRQVPFRLDVNGVHVCKYIADAVFRENGQLVVEDAKGVLTDVFKLKAKLMLACHNIIVRTA